MLRRSGRSVADLADRSEQTEPDAADGGQRGETGRTCDLAAQSREMDVDVVVVTGPRTPDIVDDLLACQHLMGMKDEQHQEIELGAGEREILPITGRDPCRRIDRERTPTDRL